jgi:hypothetical protein
VADGVPRMAGRNSGVSSLVINDVKKKRFDMKICNVKALKVMIRRLPDHQPEGRDHQEDLDIDRRIILKWIFTRMEWYVLD